MTHVRIRAGSAADLPALRGLFRRASLSNVGDRDALLAHPEALELTDHGITDGRTRVAVGADETILGFITTCPLSRCALEIEDLFVDPDSMRRGVASELVADLVATAGRRGVDRIEVTANPHATVFYRPSPPGRSSTLALVMTIGLRRLGAAPAYASVDRLQALHSTPVSSAAVD